MVGEKTIRRTLSVDGTEIGYVLSGEGPPVLLVHGALSDRTRFEALRPHLEPHATVYAMDRRGRGLSGDGPDYDIERENEDVAAVVEAAPRAAGAPVAVYGHSGGASFALGASGADPRTSTGWRSTSRGQHPRPVAPRAARAARQRQDRLRTQACQGA